MKKGLKITLIVLGSIILLSLIAAGIGYYYVHSSFLAFEKGFEEKKSFKELTIDGYTFLDRNDNGQLDVYEDSRRSLDERVADLLKQMTREEKIHLLKGSGLASALGMVDPGTGIPGAVGTIVPTPRLGLPTVYLSDGPAGLRIEPKREGEDRTYYCTAYPIGTMLSSTWNVNMVQQVGEAMGNEALEYGLDVILGPGANIHRHPLCGRNFEYYSEDPYLSGTIGAAMVNGIESNGVGTSVKHFVANNQETARMRNDVIVSERAFREIYLKGFEIIVKQAQPWTIMSSYNKVNGTYTSADKRLLTTILREEWGFQGLVMSDWFGGNDAPAMIQAGNDLLEPGTNHQWKALKKAAKDGSLTESDINTSVARILHLVLTSRKMQGYQYSNDPDLKSHAVLAREAAGEGVVLLKNNNNTLPLSTKNNVALLGVTSYDFIAGGTGSGDVNEAYTVSLEEGLSKAGFTINEAAKKGFEEHRAAHPKEFIKPQGMNAMFQPYDPPEWVPAANVIEQYAQTADIAIVTIGRNSGEGGDRKVEDDFLLAANEQELIESTCKAFKSAGKKVVVVLNIGGVIETASWKEKPDAILLAWQGGQEGGNGVADIVSGTVNPSGKLPMTFPVKLEDHASNANFPLHGKPMSMFDMMGSNKEKSKAEQVRNDDYTEYAEGIFVGYRHFDTRNVEVAYPFGYGLSYTRFDYSDLNVERTPGDTLIVSLTVKNVGEAAGKEVVQVFSGKVNSAIERPTRELRAFAKTKHLQPGESEIVRLRVPVGELSYWDETNAHWTLEPGTYTIQVGASIRDIKLSKDILL